MTDIDVDVSKLPLDIRARLAELDLELSEGNDVDVLWTPSPAFPQTSPLLDVWIKIKTCILVATNAVNA